MSLEYTKSFLAKDDSGNEYQINVYTEHTETRTRGPHGIKTGRMAVKEAMRLEDGRHVNWRAKGEYETVDPPQIVLRSDDPNAV